MKFCCFVKKYLPDSREVALVQYKPTNKNQKSKASVTVVLEFSPDMKATSDTNAQKVDKRVISDSSNLNGTRFGHSKFLGQELLTVLVLKQLVLVCGFELY